MYCFVPMIADMELMSKPKLFKMSVIGVEERVISDLQHTTYCSDNRHEVGVVYTIAGNLRWFNSWINQCISFPLRRLLNANEHIAGKSHENLWHMDIAPHICGIVAAI